jgi:NAD(P)-dependent dehydrogenase (short-subunit alcohol dehydrogenase family)
MGIYGHRALVTGGAGDIGAAMGAELQRRGTGVTLLDIKDLDLARPFIERSDDPAQIVYRQVDVSDRAALDHVFAEEGPYDRVLVNAGVGGLVPFLEISTEQWDRMITINLTGAFHTAQAAARAMVRASIPGRIIFTGSWVGSMPWPNVAHYSVTKAGLQMLARSMAQELASHGILVNVIAPGCVDAGLAGADMRADPAYAGRVRSVVPLGKLESPEEVAAAAAFLCGPDASYITGTTLTVDGGVSLGQFSVV